MYRDCLAGQAPFDDVITLFVFETNSRNAVQFIQVTRPPSTPQIQPENLDACVARTPNICVQEGIYTATIVLPPKPGGYDLAWTRCCRNQAITNLIRPLAEGITFLAHVPDPNDAPCNTMPSFDNVPPIFLCKDQQFAFDHSASDPDGDSLSYAITNPYTGLNSNGMGTGNPNLGGNPPVVDRFENPMGPPPYRSVRFAPGYRFNDPFGSGNFNIDPATGFITVTPDEVGIYVYSISVFEWRNGTLLGENRRDFQIHVLDCLPQGDPPKIEKDFGDLTVIDDTIYVRALQDFSFDVKISDPNPMDQLTAYTVSAAFGNGPFFRPPAFFEFGGINPLEGTVRWKPSCFYQDQVVPLIIGARDINDCPFISDVFDTVWVNISVPPNDPPQIIPDYTGFTRIDDTLLVSAENEFCFPFDIIDPEGDSLDAFTLSPIFSDSFPPSFSLKGMNPVQGEICWTPTCEREGEVIELSFGALDRGICSVRPLVNNSIYVKIEVPDNAPPEIEIDYENNILEEDTIQINAEDELCFSFTATDPDVDDFLQVLVEGELFSAGNNMPEVKTSGLNPLTGSICWTPSCDLEDQLVSMVVKARDMGVCEKVGEAMDTIFIRINTPDNDPPVIFHDLTENANVSGDTVFVFADENLTYSFTVTDPNIGDSLRLAPISDPFNIPDNPNLTISGVNPLLGTVEWKLSCEQVGKVIPLVIQAQDNGKCSSMAAVFDTVYVAVMPPPNDPPNIVHDLGGLTVSGDTIIVSPLESFCYTISAADPDTGDSLRLETLSPAFDVDSGASIIFEGINPLNGEICWTPSCDFDSSVTPLIVEVSDNGSCNNALSAFDTVFVKIFSRPGIAPDVDHDLTGNEVTGDTILIDVDEALCYSFYVADKTDFSPVDYTFEFQEFDGTSIALGEADVVVRNDSILGEICFQSDCANGGSLYRVIVTGFDLGICPPFPETKDTVFIKVNTSFRASLGPDITFCAGSGGAQLDVSSENGNAPFFYKWDCIDNPNCGINDPFSASPTVNPGDSTTIFVQVTDKDGCTSEIDSIRIGVNPFPIVDAGGDTGRCTDEGGVQLQARITNEDVIPGPYTFEWFPKSGLSDAFVANPVATPDSSTIYTVIVNAPNGCTSEVTNLDTLSTVYVGVSERPNTQAGADREICIGDTIRLEGFATGGNPNYSFKWEPALGLEDTLSQAPNVSPSITTTYYLQSFADGCPGSIDSVTIQVHALPEVSGIQEMSLCANDTAQLSISTNSLNQIVEYNWSPSTELNDPSISNPLISPDENITYKFTATTDRGCQNEPFEVAVSVLPTPDLNAGEDVFLCQGDSLQLVSKTNIINGTSSSVDSLILNWYDGSSLLEDNPRIVVKPDQTTLYKVTAELGECRAEDFVKVDVFNKLELSLETEERAICEGDSVRLFANAGRGNEKYEWFPKEHIDNPLLGSPVVSPQISTIYKVVVEEGACIAEDSILIEVGPTPVVDFLSSINSGCEDLTVAFEETSSGASSFVWDFGDGSEFSTGPTAEHTYTEPGRYEVLLKAFGSTGCTSSSAMQVVNVFPQVTADFESEPDILTEEFSPGSEIHFVNQSTDGASILWKFGDGEVSTDVNPIYQYTSPGTYEIKLIASFEGACVDSISLGPIVVNAPNLFIPNVFTPNGDSSHDTYKINYTGIEAFALEIFDRWGMKVTETITEPDNGWNGEMKDGSPAVEGVYYYRLQIGEKQYQGNLTLMR